jgi:hypothetical protein
MHLSMNELCKRGHRMQGAKMDSATLGGVGWGAMVAGGDAPSVMAVLRVTHSLDLHRQPERSCHS